MGTLRRANSSFFSWHCPLAGSWGHTAERVEKGTGKAQEPSVKSGHGQEISRQVRWVAQ